MAQVSQADCAAGASAQGCSVHIPAPIWKAFLAWLQLYATRLAVDPFTDVVHSGVSLAGSLLAEALGDTNSIQFPPSLLAAAALYCARRTQVGAVLAPCPCLLSLCLLRLTIQPCQPLLAASNHKKTSRA